MSKTLNLLILALLLLGCALPSQAITADPGKFQVLQTEPVWEETFSDTDITDWEIFGHSHSQGIIGDGSYEIINGCLNSTGTDHQRNIAVHDSYVAFGTWSFDVFIGGNSSEYIVIELVGIGEYVANARRNGYGVAITSGEFQIFMNHVGMYPKIFGSFATSIIKDSWYHIDVTRNTNKLFRFYLDGDLKFSKTEISYSTSEEFSLRAAAGVMFDNITVYDTVMFDTFDPEFDHELDDQAITADQDFRYDINASDDTELSWVVDNDLFAIDIDGVLTNKETLDVGTYALTITITDAFEHSISDSFTLTVNESTALPLSLYPVLCAVLVLAIRRNKRY